MLSNCLEESQTGWLPRRIRFYRPVWGVLSRRDPRAVPSHTVLIWLLQRSPQVCEELYQHGFLAVVSLLTQGCSTTCLPKPKPVCLGEMKTSKENKHIHLLYNQSGQEHFLFFVFKRELSKMSVCQLNKRDHLPCKLNSFAMLGCEVAVALDLPGVAFLTISDLTLGVGGWDCSRFPVLNGCVCCSVPDLCVVGAS